MESALNGLSRIEVVDVGVRAEVEGVERELRRIRSLMEGHRWI